MDSGDNGNDHKPLVADGSKFQLSVYELRKSPLRAAAVCLGLLCVLLLAVIIGQRVHYNKTERDQQNSYNALSKEKDNLQESLKTMQAQKKELEVIQSRLQNKKNYLTARTDQLKTSIDTLKRDKNNLKTSQSQLQTSNNALTKERNQLKIKQDQLQMNVQSLSKAIDLLQTILNSTYKQRDEWQSSYNNITMEKDVLQKKCNNLNISNEQLQVKYNNLTKTVEQLQLDYNSTTSEKDKLHSSHINLTKERDTLQASYDLVKEAIKELKEELSYFEYDSGFYGMVYEFLAELLLEEERLCDELTADREKLQKEVERLNATIGDKTCPPDWKKFQYSCYFTSTTKKSWMQSREDCQNKAADLVIINSQEEMTFINGLYAADKEVWIGLTDEGVEGQWKWVDGKPLEASKAFWGSNQPNSYNGTNQDCVEVWHRVTGQGGWNDESCGKQREWICEK